MFTLLSGNLKSSVTIAGVLDEQLRKHNSWWLRDNLFRSGSGLGVIIRTTWRTNL